MTTVVKIDGDAIDLAEFVRMLKLTGQFEALLEQFVRDRLTALARQESGHPGDRRRRSRSAPTSFAGCAACTVRPTPTSTSMRCASAWRSSRPSSPTACTRKR